MTILLRFCFGKFENQCTRFDSYVEAAAVVVVGPGGDHVPSVADRMHADGMQMVCRRGQSQRPPPQGGGGRHLWNPLWLCSYVALWLCSDVAM